MEKRLITELAGYSYVRFFQEKDYWKQDSPPSPFMKKHMTTKQKIWIDSSNYHIPEEKVTEYGNSAHEFDDTFENKLDFKMYRYRIICSMEKKCLYYEFNNNIDSTFDTQIKHCTSSQKSENR